MKKSKNITIRDIAREAGVSASTISNILNNKKKASEETKKKVMEIIDKYNFSPSISASTLVNKKSQLIAIIIPFMPLKTPRINHYYILENPFYTEFISGAEFQAKKLDFNLLITTLAMDSDIKVFNRRNLEGGIIIGNMPRKMTKKLKTIINSKIVLVDNFTKGENFFHLMSHDEKGGYLATKHLIEMGHRNIAYCSGNFIGENVFKKRYNGYVKALDEHHIPVNPDYIIQCDDYAGEGQIVANKVMENREITAIFSAADIYAFEIIKHLKKNKVKVPDEISIVGFDDLQYCSFVTPQLTTVKQDIFQKGITAVNMIAKKHTQKEIFLDVELIKRDSVKKI